MGTYQVLLIPNDDGEPPRRVDVEQDTQSALPQLQELVGGDIEALPVPEDGRLTTYINEDGKALELPLNRCATRLIGPLLFAGDYIAGPLIVCGFDPDRGRDLDCPPGFEDRLAIRRPLPTPTGQEQGERSITYTWQLREDEHGGRELTAIIDNRSEQPGAHGGMLVRVRLGSGLAIRREPAGRFSAKRLAQFADTALTALGELYGNSDPRLTRYFKVANGGSL